MNSNRPHGITAVVTGSSSGLSGGIALTLATAGAQLGVCADLKEIQDARSTMDLSFKASKGADMAFKALEVAINNSENEADTPTHELNRSRYREDRAFYIRCDNSLEEDDVENDFYSTSYAIQAAVHRNGRLDLVVSLSFSGCSFPITKRADKGVSGNKIVNSAEAGTLDIPMHDPTASMWNKCLCSFPTRKVCSSLSLEARQRGRCNRHVFGHQGRNDHFLKQNEDENGIRGNIINISSIAGSSGLPGCCEFFICPVTKLPSGRSRG